MADRTAPVVKLNPYPALMGHNLAKTCTFHLNGPIMRQKEAYQVIFCTLKLLPVLYFYFQLLGCMGKNKAKTAVSVAVEVKPEVEIWRRQYKTSQIHDRQTDDRQQAFCIKSGLTNVGF